ncbi:MAG: type II toxin-antitoxin system VapC family toxin [Aureliella sp.]
MLVVDASVAAKWFFSEADSHSALELFRTDFKLVGPGIIRLEVASAFARRARDDQITAEDALDNRDRWLSAIATNAIRLEDQSIDLAVGLELALRLKHLLPDCVYLAMAMRYEAPLVTADEKFARKASKEYEKVLGIEEALALSA